MRSDVVLTVGLPLALVLTLVGCSADYQGERLLWKAQQGSAEVLKDASRASPEQFATAVEAFGAVVRLTPGTASAARAQATIGSLYAARSQYEQARLAYTLLLRNYGHERGLALNARVAIAKTYEREQDWDNAMKVHDEIAEQHPWTTLGLQAPLSIAQTYERRGDREGAMRAYERAVQRYTRLAANAPSPELASYVKGHLALAYQQLGEWEDAVSVLEELARTPAAANRPLALLMAGSIYQTHLADAKKAEEAYTTLITDFPEHPLSHDAKMQLERLVGVPWVQGATPPR